MSQPQPSPAQPIPASVAQAIGFVLDRIEGGGTLVTDSGNRLAQRAKLGSPRLRFWARVDVRGPSECWEWTGARSSNGYGTVRVFPAQGKRRAIGAHRAAWIYANAPIPDGLQVCHRCDNPPCCNPDHLFLGTPKDNLDDMFAKGRQRFAHGEDAGHARLTVAAVLEIRRRCAAGELQRVVAKDFGVRQAQVSRIVRGERWAKL